MVVRRGQKTDNEGQQAEEDGWHSWRLPDPISSPAPLVRAAGAGAGQVGTCVVQPRRMD